MLSLVLKALLLVMLIFAAFAWLGWKIAGLGAKKSVPQSHRPVVSHLDLHSAEPQVKPADTEHIEVTIVAPKRVAKPDINISSLAEMTPDMVEQAVKDAGAAQKPNLLTKPEGAIDDLKIISGIGPVNEKELHELGIFHFWQIAEWTPENIAWVSEHIRFPTRIVRENWMAQAVKLMSDS